MFAALLNLVCYSLTANVGLSVCSGIVQTRAHCSEVSLEVRFILCIKVNNRLQWL